MSIKIKLSLKLTVTMWSSIKVTASQFTSFCPECIFIVCWHLRQCVVELKLNTQLCYFVFVEGSNGNRGQMCGLIHDQLPTNYEAMELCPVYTASSLRALWLCGEAALLYDTLWSTGWILRRVWWHHGDRIDYHSHPSPSVLG